MRWARIEYGGEPVYGVVEGDAIRLVRGDPFDGHTMDGRSVALAEARWLPPVMPPTFYCVGQNYAEHVRAKAREEGREPNLPRKPDVGYRAQSALVGHGASIEIPADASEAVQYEGELVCVVGRRAKHLTADNALGCLLGYTIGNDVSERTWQREDRTIWRAKNADTFKPMGPWIETDFDLGAARTRVRVNGEQQIEFATADMLFGVVDFLVAITRYITLVPGDVLWMGTEGEAKNLVPGDVVEIEIAGIGTLRNPVGTAEGS